MQIHTYQNRRIVQHTDSHYDIEETRAVLAESGEIVGCEWAVIFCSEDEMYNGWTPTIPQEVRIANILNQVPQEYRARATRECYGENDHEFERKLTGYVIMRIWETYEHPVNEAEFQDAWCDERVDTGITDDRPYRPVSGGDDIPF